MHQYNNNSNFTRNGNTGTRGSPFTATSTNSSPYFHANSGPDYMQTPRGINRNLPEVNMYQTASSTPLRNLRQAVLNFNVSGTEQYQLVENGGYGRPEQNKPFYSIESKVPKREVDRLVSNGDAPPSKKLKVVKREEKSANKKITETMRMFTGTAEKIIKWNKKQKNYFCLYELFASIVNIQSGSIRLQQIMLLRDKKGPIIQVVHYINDHIDIENFSVGQMLRCVGRMIGPNIMHAVSIREATEEELFTLQRISYICDDAVTKTTKG